MNGMLRGHRRGRRRAIASVVLACAITLSLVATALAATPFEQTYNAYRKTGRVPPCQFSVDTLRKAKAEVPPDIEQYAPDFPAALDAALQARASGACSPHAAAPASTGAPAASTGGGAPPPASGSGGGTATPAPSPLAPSSSSAISGVAASSHVGGASSAPAPVIALAIVLVLMAMAALWWSLTAWRGLEPRWLVGARHAWAEAGYRASGTWAEFTDWVKLGR